jgi:hypothetical protein
LITVPVIASQIRAVLSHDVVTMRDPSEGTTHKALVLTQHRDFLRRRGVLDARGVA